MLQSHSGILVGEITMHRIFIHMYSTASVGPSYIESLTGFLNVPLPLTVFSTCHHRTSSFCSLPIISSLNQKNRSLTKRTLKKKIQKFLRILKKNPKKNRKVYSYPSLPGNSPNTEIDPNLKFNLLIIRPLLHVIFVTPKLLYN